MGQDLVDFRQEVARGRLIGQGRVHPAELQADADGDVGQDERADGAGPHGPGELALGSGAAPAARPAGPPRRRRAPSWRRRSTGTPRPAERHLEMLLRDRPSTAVHGQHGELGVAVDDGVVATGRGTGGRGLHEEGRSPGQGHREAAAPRPTGSEPWPGTGSTAALRPRRYPHRWPSGRDRRGTGRRATSPTPTRTVRSRRAARRRTKRSPGRPPTAGPRPSVPSAPRSSRPGPPVAGSLRRRDDPGPPTERCTVWIWPAWQVGRINAVTG